MKRTSMPTVRARHIEELKQLTLDELQQETLALYTAACVYQKHACQHFGDKDEFGHCFDTIEMVQQIGLVVKVLIERDTPFIDNHFPYPFPAEQGLLMAKAIDEIFIKHFHEQCSEALISTMVVEEHETKDVLVATVISVTDEEHAKGIVAMTLAMSKYAEEGF